MQPEENSRPTEIDIFQALKDFALGPEEEIETQTTEELEMFLAENHVSIEPSKAELKDQLQAARNKLRLSVAREQRLREQNQREHSTPDKTRNQFTGAAQGHILTGPALQDIVQQRLSRLQPGVARMFARNFQECDDDDLRAILNAIDRLEEDTKE